tara:strand:+ start:1643 stop:2401 length:759 start_codon:yes stop_codon:yes gene_type:complete
MNFKKLILFLFIFSCTIPEKAEIKQNIIFDKTFSNTGFSLVYNKNLKKQKKISSSIDEKSLIIFQKNLKKNTPVKITNLENNKSIVAIVGVEAEYPSFYNSVISKRIAEEIELDINEPYIQLKTINKNLTFVAKKAEIFEEEKKVADKAPVQGITIKSIGISTNIKEKKIVKFNKSKFNYIIKIAEFYFLDSANLLTERISNELGLKNVNISKLSPTIFRVYLGPFNNLDSLKKAFDDISKLNFENIEMIKI